jgi:hypothetical protein
MPLAAPVTTAPRPIRHLGFLSQLFTWLLARHIHRQGSVVIMIEAQVRYLVQAMALAGDRVLQVRPEALDGFMAEVDQQHLDQVWLSGCRSWYLNDDGQNFTIWPGSPLSFLWRTRRPNPDDLLRV